MGLSSASFCQCRVPLKHTHAMLTHTRYPNRACVLELSALNGRQILKWSMSNGGHIFPSRARTMSAPRVCVCVARLRFSRKSIQENIRVGTPDQTWYFMLKPTSRFCVGQKKNMDENKTEIQSSASTYNKIVNLILSPKRSGLIKFKWKLPPMPSDNNNNNNNNSQFACMR